MEVMDVKSWALLISLMAFTLSVITFVKTQLWNSLKFDCRIIDFSWKIKGNRNFCETKFLISSSGNQNIYIDKLFINTGENTAVTDASKNINVQKLLKPGEIEEFICNEDASLFSHNEVYTFIFTFLSANTDQFHCTLQMRTEKQKENSLIVYAKSFGSGFFELNSFSLWRNNKVRKSRKQRRQN